MNIIFFGTPYFSAYSLKKLINSKYKVVGIVTKPDTQKGRGRKTSPSEVKKVGLLNNIPILEPINFEDTQFIKKLKMLKADLFIVIAFDKLPSIVWKIPKKGTINLHTSFLPKYRGAAPINRVIMNGEKNTGITTFYINDKIDAGDIILQKRIQIREKTTAAQLHNEMMRKGAKLILETISNIKKNKVTIINQKPKNKYIMAHKINKDICKINWEKSITDIYNLIRGVSPLIDKDQYIKDVSICPSAWCILNNGKIKKRLKINHAEIIKGFSKDFLSISTNNKDYLYINLREGALSIKYLQLEGKRPMNIQQFLRGNKIYEDYSIS